MPFSLQKHLILLIKGLCTGCSRLDRTEIITFTAMMKSAKLPQTVKTLSDGRKLIRGYIAGALELGIDRAMGLVCETMVCCFPCSRGPEGACLPGEPRAKAERSADELPQSVDICL